MADVILKAEHLKIGFFSERHSLFEKRKRNEVLKDLSFTMEKGEVLGLVGESGCGKSTLAKVILGLLKPDSGTVIVSGNRPQMVFQDPYGSLNPAKKIGWIMEEPLRIQRKLPGKERRQKVLEMLKKVGLDEIIADRYPNQLSGGQRQRVCIGEALMTNPGLLVADEAVSALDVTIQAQILDLLRMIQQELDTATILVSHDLGVVARVADRVAIMYAGKIVEIGTAKEIFYDPRHPYTWGLMQSLPGFSRGQNRLHTIPGMPPSLVHLPKGDAFAARNEYALGIDYEQEPPMFQITKTHYAATWLLDKRAPKIECPIKRGRNDE